ncbi:MAG: hypothetical protein JSR33_10905, partial [Proteobacteria bacterium]|nr:hypothetical protein [Pseudomonadota bacterium]
GCQPSLGTHVRRQIQARTPEGFNLFVATVYGEMAGVKHSPTLVWQAVGSVIMNRVHTGIWHRYKTTDEIIIHTGFDAYASLNKINWNNVNFNSQYIKNHQQFLKAWASLNEIQINHHDAMNGHEKTVLSAVERSLRDVYFGHKLITPANYYYSPRSMFGKTPSFLAQLDNPEQYRVNVTHINESEIRFYNIPAKIERAAGRKK